MLSSICVNSNIHIRPTRPESASFPRRKQETINYIHTKNAQTLISSHDKIILPVKEYSNKFLRENKPTDDVLYKNTILRPKKSIICTRKQFKYKKNRYPSTAKDKQNEIKYIKTQNSDASGLSFNQSFVQPAHSVSCSFEKEIVKEYLLKPSQTGLEKSPNVKNKISTSRALEKFSKVFKNENIQRVKIRKQIINKTSDVQIKQVLLRDKEKQKQKEKEKIEKLKPSLLTSATNSSTSKYLKTSGANSVPKKLNIITSSLKNKEKKKNKLLFMEDENFQLIGW